MSEIRVLVVEDDPMVAELESEYLRQDNRIDAVSVQTEGSGAWQYLQEQSADLLVLDAGLPGLDGFTLLERLRESGMRADAIFVTASRAWEDVELALRLGALDYLVKPFRWARFQQALERFFFKNAVLSHGTPEASQGEVDRLFALGGTELARSPAEKGIQPPTLELVMDFFQAHGREAWSCGAVAEAVGLSRVTVSKYLRYLEEERQLSSQIDYKTAGRPRVSYRLRR